MAIKSVTLEKLNLLPPPRRTGDDARDLIQLSDYCQKIYTVFDALALKVEDEPAVEPKETP